ncbi:MAG: bacteriohemerythrin [Proteobacteria bacterium]|nr:bacteriohemerythrin [Desulfobacula sp.]MBU4131125.1 bacteriohemerythrin [Pseudomonadota bacterium]
MTQIEKIEWDPKYSVDVEEIDIHQKKMFDMFNELIDMKNIDADPKIYGNMISDINDQSKLYFSREEKILRKRGYPDFESHTKAHRQFIRSSISLRREIAEDTNNLTLEAILELRDWLIRHIETCDSLYVPFLRIHQYIDEKNQKN